LDDRSAPPLRSTLSEFIVDVIARFDWLLLLSVFGLMTMGWMILTGSTQATPSLLGIPGKHLQFATAGVAILLFVAVLDYRWINRLAMGAYVANMLALVAVLIIGSKINNARSWIDFGPFNWQPSETMKIATVLVCGQWLALRPEDMSRWLGMVGPAVICGLPTLLILMQPDAGTAAVFFAIFLVMSLMAGAKLRWIATLGVSALLGLAAMFPFLSGYRRNRILTFLVPTQVDSSSVGYHVTQSKIAIGSGGWFGQGWGEGTQTTYRFLPEHHTDFIFASAIEQFGVVGGLLILGAYLLIFWRMIRAIEGARDRFGGLVVAGLFAIILAHVSENVGMTMGLVPVTGIPLPLLSYGGSFLITTCLLFGIVLNVAGRRFTFIRGG
jgi:rod shape determining protein RodA